MPTTVDIDGNIFERLRPRLRAISKRIVGSAAEADDIVQDCFMSWQSCDQHGVLAPAAWLTTVVQRRSIDRLRQRARETQALDLAAELAFELAGAAPQASPEDLLLRSSEIAAALARLRTRLPPSERLALVLHEVFDCEHADIAALLATSTANSRQLLLRARRRLQACDGDADALPPGEKLCRELVRAFQAAINGMDREAVITLLGEPQPVAVRDTGLRARACANDGRYRLAACG